MAEETKASTEGKDSGVSAESTEKISDMAELSVSTTKEAEKAKEDHRKNDRKSGSETFGDEGG